LAGRGQRVVRDLDHRPIRRDADGGFLPDDCQSSGEQVELLGQAARRFRSGTKSMTLVFGS
jgi:hypothetical protein